MKNIDDLIDTAGELAEHGQSPGEIADELNVSRSTAAWLLEQAEAGGAAATAVEPTVTPGPQDIHVDWSTLGRSGRRLDHVGAVIADVAADADPDLVVGVEKAGTPLAAATARELDAGFGAYAPAKHQWEEGDIEELGGAFSRNFAPVEGERCVVVDDTITSGTTITETVEAIRDRGGDPVACVVLADKQGVESVSGVPVRSLVQVIRVGEE